MPLRTFAARHFGAQTFAAIGGPADPPPAPRLTLAAAPTAPGETPTGVTYTVAESAATLTGSDGTPLVGSDGTPLVSSIPEPVTLWAAPFAGAEGGLQWEAVGSRTGDGSTFVELDPGHYWAAASTADGWAAPVYAVVPTGESVRTRVVRAVFARVQAVGLLRPEGGPMPVYLLQNVQASAAEDFPCVEVRRGRLPDQFPQALSGRDDVSYPVDVEFKFRSDLGPDAVEQVVPAVEGYMQALRRAFHNQRLPGVPESVRCEVADLTVLEPWAGQYQLITNGASVRCVCREPRGLGA